MTILRTGLLCALVALSALLSADPAAAQSAFYRAASSELAGPPGSVIRAEPMAGAPAGAATWRVLYRSVGLRGEPIAVSGVVILPPGPPPAEGRPIVAWAHPTTGVAPRCAPSVSPFLFPLIPGLRDMLARGYVVAATDYPGLGTPGPHPYLVGVSEGRAVLDSVRAARALPDSGASNRYAVWGHSQGGHAGLFAGLLAAHYAPELDLAGIAVAAPATDLATLVRDDFASSSGRNISAMTLWSWSRVFDAPLDGIVEPAARSRVDTIAQECIGSVFDIFQRRAADAFLATTFLDVPDITAVQPWRGLMRQNSPGLLPAHIPAFIAQGTADQLVRPEITYAYASGLCREGARTTLLRMPGVDHGFAGYRAAGAAMDWIAARFAGYPALGNCGT